MPFDRNKPAFADPKTGLAFKKIFGQPSGNASLIGLLNALLRLPDEARIIDLEYLTPEQLPAHEGLKLSILDVKCLDVTGARYVVEMQVFQVEGFEKRVVYNACKAYVEQLGEGASYSQLNDVIAVTICNFKLWPDTVDMLSRWRMREDRSGETGLQQVQYVFLELPKYPAGQRPRTHEEKWAWFFRETLHLREVPEDLREAPFATALEAARRVNFNDWEWTEYEREKMAEEAFYGGLSFAQKEGYKLGKAEGLRLAIADRCELLGLPLGPAEHAHLARLNAQDLEALRLQIKASRRWPEA